MANAPKPKKTYRVGSISLTVFPEIRKTEDGKKFTTYGAKLSKFYKTEEGQNRYDGSMNPSDLLNAAGILQKAWNDIISNEFTNDEEN